MDGWKWWIDGWKGWWIDELMDAFQWLFDGNSTLKCVVSRLLGHIDVNLNRTTLESESLLRTWGRGVIVKSWKVSKLDQCTKREVVTKQSSSPQSGVKPKEQQCTRIGYY
jgi:hypothetical protein